MKANGVLIKSDRALEAETNHRFPMSTARRQLRHELQARGITATIYGCELLLRKYGDFGEWHHVSKFARRVDYFDVAAVVEAISDMTPEAFKNLSEVAKSQRPRRLPPKQRSCFVSIKYRQYRSRTNYRILRYEGPAEIRGDWIHFNGTRKRLSGKFITVERVDGQMDEEVSNDNQQQHRGGEA